MSEAQTPAPADETRSQAAWPAALAFVVYAVVAWVPCLVGGIFIGGALAASETDDGVTQGRTLGLAGALPEILVSTLLLLAIAYVGPVIYLNRKRRP